MSLFKKKNESGSGVFYKEKGAYIELDEMPGVGSLNDIAMHFGYNNNQFYSYFTTDNSSKISDIIFEKFSDNIICVLTKKGENHLTDKEVIEFIQKYDCVKFDEISCAQTLEDGILFEDLPFEFLQKTMDLKTCNNGISYTSEKWGVELIFEGEIFVRYNYTDGVEKWARYFRKNIPNLYNSFFKYSKRFWINDETSIINELNIQFCALASVPSSLGNEYLQKYLLDLGVYNFVLLLIHEYSYEISYSDFQIISYKRAEEIYNDDDGACIRWGDFYYIFGKDKMFLGYKHYSEIKA